MHYNHADANGNVTALINTNGLLVASYTYDPFGNMLSMSGPLADANVYRFSSKEFGRNSGLYYYGYRFYDANSQRWLNRDPIHEQGGLNLFAFADNAGLAFIDPFGLDVAVFCGGASSYNLPGRTTANGAMFNAEALTAAMPADLVPKLGTQVTIEYYPKRSDGTYDTPKVVKVLVNDRGPFATDKNGKAKFPLAPHPNRVIDLSPAAMEALTGNAKDKINNVVIHVPDSKKQETYYYPRNDKGQLSTTPDNCK